LLNPIYPSGIIIKFTPDHLGHDHLDMRDQSKESCANRQLL